MAIEQSRVADPGVLLVGRIAAAIGVGLEEIVPQQSPPVSKLTGILSIGYEGLDLDTFLAALSSRRVETVADVRLTPLSRKAGFSKTRLAVALGDRGIAYKHFRALGNPKDNRDGFRKGTPEALRRFSEVLDSAEARSALHDLAESAEKQLVAVLCFEHDHCHCHRKLIIDRVCDSVSTSVVLAQ